VKKKNELNKKLITKNASKNRKKESAKPKKKIAKKKSAFFFSRGENVSGETEWKMVKKKIQGRERVWRDGVEDGEELLHVEWSFECRWGAA
jgi:hypothetical protein